MGFAWALSLETWAVVWRGRDFDLVSASVGTSGLLSAGGATPRAEPQERERGAASMIPLTNLSDPSNLVAFHSLGVLAIVFGGLPAERVMPMWIRKRHEVALIWAIACLHRGAETLHLALDATVLHHASAVVTLLAAVSPCWPCARALVMAETVSWTSAVPGPRALCRLAGSPPEGQGGRRLRTGRGDQSRVGRGHGAAGRYALRSPR